MRRDLSGCDYVCHIYGAGWLAGIGFTMSLFIADLAFPDDPLLDVAKLGILTASLVAGAVGWVILRSAGSSPPAAPEASEHQHAS